MAIGGQAAPWRLRAYLNWERFGWSEVYWLRTADLAEALAASAELLTRRRLWFGFGARIEYACLCRGDAALDSWAVNIDAYATFPPGPWPQPAPPDNPEVCWQYRVEAADDRFTHRDLHFIPDDWVSGNRAAGPLARLGPLGPGPLPPVVLGPGPAGSVRAVRLLAGQGLEVLQRSFLDALVRYTGFVTPPGGVPPGGPWNVTPLDRVLYRQVGSRQCGHNFRRYSVESLSVRWRAGYADPPFSFAGQCVGVARTAYTAPVRWQEGGPRSLLRFYCVPRSSPVFYGQLRFGPKISEPNYRNLAGVGEITDSPREWYGCRNRYPARDGTHPQITADEAAGRSVWPATWAEGMPGSFLPSADYPLGPEPARLAMRLGLRARARSGPAAPARFAALLGSRGGVQASEQAAGALASALELWVSLFAPGTARAELAARLQALGGAAGTSQGGLTARATFGLQAGLKATAAAGAALAAALDLAAGLKATAAAGAALAAALDLAAGLDAASQAAGELEALWGCEVLGTGDLSAGTSLAAVLQLAGGLNCRTSAAQALAAELALAGGLRGAAVAGAVAAALLQLQGALAAIAAGVAALLASLGARAGLAARPTAGQQLAAGLGLAGTAGATLTAAADAGPVLALQAALSKASAAAGQVLPLLAAAAGQDAALLQGQQLATLFEGLAGLDADTAAAGDLAALLQTGASMSSLTAGEGELLAQLALKGLFSALTEAEASLLAALAAKAAGSAAAAQGQADTPVPPGKVTITMSMKAISMVTPGGGCGSLPDTLVIRYTSGTGGLAGLAGSLVVVTYAAGTQLWTGSSNVGGTSYAHTFQCHTGSWTLGIQWAANTASGTLTGTTGQTPDLNGTVTESGPAGTVHAEIKVS